MDNYIEYQILTGEDEDFEKDNSSNDDSGGWIILIIIAVLWIIGKLFS